MPILFDIEHYREKFNCDNWFETGLWDSTNPTTSLNIAVKCNFKKLFSIEIRKDFVDLGNHIFSNDINKKRVKLINDDSTNLYKYIEFDNIFLDKTMFFLDAHVDNINIHNYKLRCPLFEELEAINKLTRKDNIILIDDLRILKQPNPWDEYKYGNINYLERIKEKVLDINSNYKFDTLKGIEENDILICYI